MTVKPAMLLACALTLSTFLFVVGLLRHDIPTTALGGLCLLVSSISLYLLGRPDSKPIPAQGELVQMAVLVIKPGERQTLVRVIDTNATIELMTAVFSLPPQTGKVYQYRVLQKPDGTAICRADLR